MIDKFRNIFKKLNKLNSDIVFFYYSKYRNDKFQAANFSSDFSNINLNGFYIDGGMTSMSERYTILKTELPYYYKMINLYAHLTSIIEYNYGHISIIYKTVHDNFISNGDIPQDTIKTMLSGSRGYTFGILTDQEKEAKNKELKILMKNANKLNSEFRKYGKNEDEFCRNSSLNDYKYMSDVAAEKLMKKELRDSIIDTQKVFELEKLERRQKAEATNLVNQMMGQNPNASIMPASTTSFIAPPDELMKDELKYLLNLRDADIISKQTYLDRVNVVILKYNKKKHISPGQSSNPIVNNTGLYDKLMKMNPMLDDEIVKKIIEESECKKDGI